MATDKIVIAGYFGTSYPFSIYVNDSYWNEVPGVYFVTKKDSLNKYMPLYVGITENLKQRFSNHHKLQAFQRQGWTHLGFLYEPDEVKRRAIERDLLLNYCWECNDS